MQTSNSAKLKSYTFAVNGLEEPLRFDQAIVHFLPEVSRIQARKLIVLGAAWVNEQRVQVQSHGRCITEIVCWSMRGAKAA